MGQALDDDDIFEERETRHLSVVDDQDTLHVVGDAEVRRLKTIPYFEGMEVGATKVSFTSGTNLEIDDEVLRMDDIVYFVVESRISNVNHKMNERTGVMERVHTAKVIDVALLPPEFDLVHLKDKLS